jgi:hypothetical protein
MYGSWFNLTRTQCRDIDPCTGTMRANSHNAAICLHRAVAHTAGRGPTAIVVLSPQNGAGISGAR